MSPRLPRWTAKDLIRFLKKNGFKESGQSGSHLHLINEKTGKQTTVPVHSGKIIGLGLFKAIILQAGIDPKELL